MIKAYFCFIIEISFYFLGGYMKSENKTSKTKIQINKEKLPNCIFDIFKTVIFLFAIISVVFTFFYKRCHNRRRIYERHSFWRRQGDTYKLSLLTAGGRYCGCWRRPANRKIIIKRVIATEGQTIKIDYDNNKVIVDGIVLDEEYVASDTIRPTVGWNIPDTIPEGYVFVMGDNRSVSLDSRSGSIQLIPKTMILGKAQFVIYPFDHFKYLYWFINNYKDW